MIDALEFINLLNATGRSPEIPESADAYGWLIGHFGWVLEGRAVQDVWIMPRVLERTTIKYGTGNMYGSTFRVWDSSIQAWRISWKNPVENHFEEQIGRWVGEDVVQTGTRANGTITRWRFTEIMPNSFHWLGESLEPDGQTWRLEGEFLAKRIR